MPASPDTLLGLLASGPQTAQQLAAGSGISQPTVSRLIRQLGDGVLRLGRGRNTRYALPRNVLDQGSRFPLRRMDEQGHIQYVGELTAFVGGYVLLLPDGTQWVYDDLPWFLWDMRLQGFVGREILAAYLSAIDTTLPEKLADWTSDQILYYLVQHGHDGTGDLVLGNSSAYAMADPGMTNRRILSAASHFRGRHIEFPEEAELSLHNMGSGLAPSSAAGEQPKFPCFIPDLRHHTLVKFSPPLGSALGRRWSDLLMAEHLALTILNDAGMQAASSSPFRIEDRVYLEVERFDRIGIAGRRGLVSLEAVNMEFAGVSGGWALAGERLHREGVISKEDSQTMARLEAFGRWIANTDMHYGNLSFFRAPDFSLTLAPVYDMLPMHYAPVAGQLVDRDYVARMPVPSEKLLAPYWDWACQLACRFWRHIAEDTDFSEDFRRIAEARLHRE